MHKETYEALKRVVGAWNERGKKITEPEQEGDRQKIWGWIDGYEKNNNGEGCQAQVKEDWCEEDAVKGSDYCEEHKIEFAK